MKCKECGHEVEIEFEVIKDLNKEIRIYKWEDKLIKDFKMPKGFKLAEHKDFVKLYDKNKIKLEKYPIVYFTENQSKKNIKNGWELSRFYLYSDLDLDSDGRVLADSDSDGRVVICK